MAIIDRQGLPLAVSVASASPQETKLVEATLPQRFLPEIPQRLIGDRAYDSERLDQQLRDRYGIELIAPHNVGPRESGNPGGSPAAPLPPPLENRAILCLVAQLATTRYSLGISC